MILKYIGKSTDRLENGKMYEACIAASAGSDNLHVAWTTDDGYFVVGNVAEYKNLKELNEAWVDA
jgi:hypothetical protein